MRELERIVMLKVVDEKWMNHIDSMDELKNGIGLRAYGQKDPVVQYRLEGFDMFDEMINDIKFDVTKILMHIRQQGEAKRQETVKITGAALEAIHSVDGGAKIGTDVDKTVRNEGPKVGRNEKCPCRITVRNIKIVVEKMCNINGYRVANKVNRNVIICGSISFFIDCLHSNFERRM